jgi:hypothetical protein
MLEAVEALIMQIVKVVLAALVEEEMHLLDHLQQAQQEQQILVEVQVHQDMPMLMELTAVVV